MILVFCVLLVLFPLSVQGYYQKVKWNVTTGHLDCLDVAIDDNNSIYAACRKDRLAAQGHMALIKLDENGTLLWNNSIEVDGDEGNSYGVAVDSDNNVYVAGHYHGAAFVKYAADGSHLWNVTLDSAGNQFGLYVEVDSNDNPVFYYSNSTTDGAHIRKYSSSGTLLWTREIFGSSSPASQGLTIDFWDNVIVGLIYNDNLQLRKFDSAGNPVWTGEEYDLIPGDVGYYSEIMADPNNNIVGVAKETDTGWMHIRKYDEDGDFLWSRNITGDSSGGQRQGGITIDADSNIYIHEDNELILTLLDPDGNVQHNISNFWGTSVSGRGITRDLNGDIIGTGEIGGSADLIYKLSDVNCSVITSTLDNNVTNLTHSGAYARNCIVDGSTVGDSNLESTSVITSTLGNITATDTYISGSTLYDSIVSFSVIENTVFSCDEMTINGEVKSGSLTQGQIIKNPYTYFAPFDLNAICIGALPFTGALVATPSIATNETMIVYEYLSDGTPGYSIIANVTELNNTLFSTLSLRDDGIFPDTTQNDGIYTAQWYAINSSNEQATIYAYVNDTRGNVIPFGTQITLDNTAPNASIIINEGAQNTSGRSVELQLSYSDTNGINGCRFSNYDLSKLLFRCEYEDDFNCEDSGTHLRASYNHLIGYPPPQNNFTDAIVGKGFRSFGYPGINHYPPEYNVSLAGTMNPAEGTISAWIRTGWDDANSPRTTLFQIRDIGFDNIFEVITEGGFINYRWHTGGSVYNLTYDVTWGSNEIHHIAVMYDQESAGSHEMYLYLDGTLANSSGSIDKFPENTTLLAVGGANSYARAANSTVDEFLMFGYEKNATEIAQDYNTPGLYAWQSCPATKSWLVTDGQGSKTVWLQVKDNAGNMITKDDSIVSTIIGDSSAPTNVAVSVDSYTNQLSQLEARWTAFDAESQIFFSYRIRNDTTTIVDWTLAPNNGAATSVIRSGLSLQHGFSYVFDVQACNYNDLCTSVTSLNTTVDIVAPYAPTITSTTHSNDSWSENSTIAFAVNGSDALSGIGGYSYALDASGSTTPDEIAEVSLSSTTFWNWTRDPTPAGSDLVRGSTIDSTGNPFVIGRMGAAGNAYAEKVSTAGVSLWNYTYTPPGGISDWTDGAVDSSHNLYVAGYSTEPGEQQFSIVKLNSTGGYVWNWTHNPSTSSDALEAIAVDNDGDIIAAGNDQGGIYYVVKIDSSGTQLWNWSHDATPGANEQLNAIAIDTNDNVYVAGHLDASGGDSQFFVAKLDENGAFQWNWTQNPSGASDILDGIRVDSDNNIITAGHDSAPGNYQFHVVKLSSAGSVLWNWTHNPGSEADRLFDLALDSSDNVYLAGSSNLAVANAQYYAAKLNSIGTLLWNWTANPTGSHDIYYGVDVHDGNLYFGGYEESADSLTIHKLSTDGTQMAATSADLSFSNIADGIYYLHARAVDQAGNWGPTDRYRFLVDTSVPSTPQMLSGDARQNTDNVSFTWTTSSDAHSGVMGYYLRIDNNDDFTSPEFEQFVGNVTSYTNAMGASGTWYGSVRAMNNASLNSSWSNQVSKIVDQVAPNIYMGSPVVGGTNTYSTTIPRLWATTDETTDCELIVDTTFSFDFDFTGGTYHEAEREFSAGAHNVYYRCTDLVGNVNTTSSAPGEAFTVDTTAVVASIANFALSAQNFAGSVCNVSFTLQAVGPTPLSGIEADRVTLYIAGILQDGTSLQDQGDGDYQLYFTCPPDESRYSLQMFADGVKASDNLDVSIARLFVNFNGGASLSDADSLNNLVYVPSTASVFGMATDTDDTKSNRSTTPLYLSGQVGDNMYLFLTRSQGEKFIEEVDESLELEEFYDAILPRFGFDMNAELQKVGLTLDYDRVQFDTTHAIGRGNYKLQIKNDGLIQSGEGEGKVSLTVKVT